MSLRRRPRWRRWSVPTPRQWQPRARQSQLPRLLHRTLADDRLGALRVALERLAAENARRNDLLTALLVAVLAALILSAIGFL